MNERAALPTPLRAPQRGRVLVLAPHADDEVLGCGGTLALHAAQGDRVTVWIAFDGALGGAPRLRAEEARRGGAHLGLSDYGFGGYPEGHAPSDEELLAPTLALARLVTDTAPELVYAPWSGEQHVDHHVLARVARVALAAARFAGAAWGYEVWTPLVATCVVDVTAVFERKLAALREHASQCAHTDLAHVAQGLAAQRSLYLPAPARFGEAFAPLGRCGTAELALAELVERAREARRACGSR